MIKTNLYYLHAYFKSVVIALGVLCFANFQSSAQQITTPFPETDWSVMMRDPNVSFFETKARFNEFWSNRPMEKGKGFKAFKRWEWFNEPRVNPQTGAYPEADAVWQAMQDSPEMFTLNENMLGDWTYIGNTAVPNSGGGAGRVNSVRSLPGSTTTWFACTPGGGLWKTTNSGGTWSVVGTDFLSSIGVSDVAIDYTNTNVMYIATGDGDAQDTYSLGVLKTTDGGLTWNTTGLNWNVTQTRTCSRIIIHPTNPQILICATSNGVWRTTNGGTTWAQEQSGDFVEVTFKPNDPSVVYGVSDQFYRSTNTGDTWNLITSGLPSASNAQRMAMATTIANSSYLYILVSGNDSGLQGVYRSVDGGTTFSQRMGSSPNLLGWSTTGNDNGGQGWYDLCMAADPVNAEIIYTGGVNIWKSTNGGTSFTQSAHWYGGDGNPYVHADHHFLGFVTGTTRLISGNDGGVFSTTNGGSTWSDQSSNLQIAQQYRLSVADLNSNLVITGWQDNGTNLKNGVNHTQVYGGDGMECIIDPNNSSIMYATLYYGSIQRSTNGGASWSNIVGSGGSGINSDGAWVTPFVLGTNSTHIYVGKDVVYKSTNSGSSWTALGAIGGGNCNDIAVAPSNNNYIYVSKESTLYRSTDGNTFTELTNAPNYFITDIAIHPTNPNTVWITLSNYDSGEKIYRSTDAGATWVNISSGLPNIPANAVVYQEGTSNGIYIGMDAGVYYRDDVLGSWTPFMNALPNVEITELEIHYATNTITASTYGRGLWRAQLYALPDLDAAFIAATQPTGTYCDGDITPIIEILNSGNTAITSLTINYQVSGQSLLNYNWTGSLATGNTATITLPTLNYGAGSFTINFNIVSVNGTGDENSTNNIGSSTYTTLNATNNAVLTLLTDCYPNETSWAITDENANVIYSGSGYPVTTSNVIPVCLPDGCFTFTIFDSYGDGMTSGSCPSGSYEVRDALTNTVLVLMTTAGFGTSASHNFCYPIGAIAGCTDQLACNYDPLATEDNGSCTYGQANDVCAGAISLTVNAAPVSANNLSTCSNGPNPSCGNQTGTTIRDVWFKFIYEGGPVVITTNHTGETMDTRLAVFTACGGTQIACNDDVGGGNTRSTITIACGVLTAGNTYYIQAGGYANLTGNFKIQVTAPVELCNGLDDDCDGIIDEGFSLTTYYRDLDNDGFGNLSVTTQACSAPSGYVSNSTDCNDNNAAVRPGATEVCNGIDDDCDGQIDEGVLLTFYRDLDNDGFGNLAVTTQACSAPAGYVSNSTDCNDNNAAVRPGATEVCNGIDDDCDGQIDEDVLLTFYRDLDNDGFGNLAVTTQACSAPAGYVSNSTDCNDNNAAVRPGATEVCNGIDDDCDGQIDEDVLLTFYRDFDNDGFGNLSVTTQACSAPAGYVPNSTDCNDNNAAVRPGATEVCNGIDDDCDGQIDEGVLLTFYRDLDNDGFGNLAVTTQACSAPAGYVSNSTDCNDNNPAVRPGATEVCNGIDDDCDGQIDEDALLTFYRDLDNDGFGNIAVTTQACSAPAGYVSNSTDCNDNNAAVRPGATEVCNGIDDDCDGQIDEDALLTFYRDLDNDGFGNIAVTTQACSAPAGYVSNSTDCNDNNAAVRPGATEVCNGIDDDCDGQIDEDVLLTFYRDFDNDGFGNLGVTTQACSAPAGYVSNSTDCNDNNVAVRPGATEVCNGIDDDCDGQIDEDALLTFYRDLDNDGFGNISVTTQACSAPAGYVSNSTDCNDNNAAVRPGATEVCNGIDDDCDGQIDEGLLLTFYRDLDNDGFGNLAVTTQACSAPAGYVSNSTDCNDNNAAVRPGAIELCNGIDDDCDGQIDEGCNAVAPPMNDGWANATPLVQSGNIYPNCSILSGTCAGATDSPESVQQNVVTGEDVWYKFNAVSTAARIRLLNPAFDGVLELYTNTGVLVESENLTGLSSEEAMNTSGLTQGNQYYLAVRNYNSASGNGNFSLCVQHLMPSSCAVEGSNMELCSNMKPQWTGANQYVFTFTSVENSTVTTGTSSSQLPLSTISLGLRYGSSYIAGVEAVYHLADGTGNTEVIQLPTSNTCIIQINPHPEVKVKDSQVCPSIIFRNSLLQYKPFVCGATDFDIRFTQIDGSGNPVGLPFVVSRGAAASTLHLSFINPQPLQAGARYSVEVRPVFSYGVGEYGSPRCIHISSSSMNEGDLIESPPILKSDLSIDQSVIVYPNPTIGDAINIYDSEINSIHITDCYGRKISGYVLRDNKNDMVRIEFSQRLSSGLYLLVIETENDKKMVKLIVER